MTVPLRSYRRGCGCQPEGVCIPLAPGRTLRPPGRRASSLRRTLSVPVDSVSFPFNTILNYLYYITMGRGRCQSLICCRWEGLDIDGARTPSYNLVREDMLQVEHCVELVEAAMEKWIS